MHTPLKIQPWMQPWTPGTCTCTYVYTHSYMYMCTVHVHLYIHTTTCVHVHVYMYVHRTTCTCTYVHVYNHSIIKHYLSELYVHVHVHTTNVHMWPNFRKGTPFHKIILITRCNASNWMKNVTLYIQLLAIPPFGTSMKCSVQEEFIKLLLWSLDT